jgi:hypothetical protein
MGALIIYDTAIRSPNAFLVYFDETLDAQELDRLISMVLDTPGAHSVGHSGSVVPTGEAVRVGFDGGYDDRETAALRRALARLAGVVRIQPCRC